MKNTFKTVFIKELKSISRNASSLFTSLLLPLLFLPIVLTVLLHNNSATSLENKINKPHIALFINDNGKKENITTDNKKGYDEIYKVIDETIFKDITPTYEEVEDEVYAFTSGKIDVSITFDSNLNKAILDGKTNINVTYDNNNTNGYAYASKIVSLISIYSSMINELRLQNISSSMENITGVVLNSDSLQEKYKDQKLEGLNDTFLNVLVPTFITIFLAFGSVAVTSEMFTVEKEKNTLESLLSTGAKRSTILSAKITLSILFAFASIFMQGLGILLAILFNHSYFSNMPLYFNPGSSISIILTLISTPILLSILSIAIFVYAKNNKSAMALQSILQFIPTIISFVLLFASNSIMNNIGFMFIPVVGSLFSFKLAIVGYVNISYLLFSAFTNLILAGIILFLTFKRYNSERIFAIE